MGRDGHGIVAIDVPVDNLDALVATELMYAKEKERMVAWQKSMSHRSVLVTHSRPKRNLPCSLSLANLYFYNPRR